MRRLGDASLDLEADLLHQAPQGLRHVRDLAERGPHQTVQLRRDILDVVRADTAAALRRAAGAVERLFQVEGAVVAHHFLARLDVADGDLELELARTDAVRLAA